MSISPVNSLYSTSLLQLGVLNSTQSSQQTSGTSSAVATPTDSQDISSFSQFISQLQQEATSDPTAFKQQTAQIASNLSADAQSTTGAESQFLQDLANVFQTASQSGNPADLNLSSSSATSGTQGASGHHHHHHHHSSQSQSQQSTSGASDLMSLISAALTNTTTSSATQASITNSLDSSLLTS